MYKMTYFSMALISLAVSGVFGAPYEITDDSLFKHIRILSHDSLEGREVGEPGEWKAAQYISGVFESTGLEPKGGNGSFLQTFEFTKRVDFGQNNRLTVNGVELLINEEFKPMLQSASTSFEFSGIVSVNFGITVDSSQGQYDDYEGLDVSGKAVLVKRFHPDSTVNPHIDFKKYDTFNDKINNAISKGAAAVFFYTPPDQDDTIPGFGGARVTPKEIPVVLLRKKGLEKLGLDLSDPKLMSVSGQTELIRTRDTGYNVIGYVPAKSDTTIIIGAHFDHLGWGAEGSRYTGTEKMIHNGADDNASGTSAAIELARYFASRKNDLKHSLLFCAFSGEEAGLLGSNYFSKNMTINPHTVLLMINFDMIGRLKEQESGLAIFGVGTAKELEEYFRGVDTTKLKFVMKEPGTGPSDHTSFYNQNIPVLHFFTGAHKDYHMPSDDAEFIDVGGINKVADFASATIEHFDKLEKPLAFQKTVDPNAGRMGSSFSVSLGVMPDYIAEVKGMRIDGVSANRPAERAGIKAGDIVIEMGGKPINDIYDYMGCLSKYRLHDTTQVVVQRGEQTLTLTVIFE
jgi:hypothetical protein